MEAPEATLLSADGESQADDSQADDSQAKNRPSSWRLLVAGVMLAAVVATILGMLVLPRAKRVNRPFFSQQPADANIKFTEAKGDDYQYAIFTPLGNDVNVDKYLKSDISSVLNGPYKGLLELLVLPGDKWKMLLTHVKKLAANINTADPEELVALQTRCREKMKALPENLKNPLRVRILSPLDFKDLMVNVVNYLGDDFDKFLAHATYDTPKFVGALCRMRLMGKSIPVIRLDESVLFNYHTLNKKEGYAGINTIIKGSLEDFLRFTSDWTSQGWAISQQYTGLPPDSVNKFKAWDEAYSTQAKPPLLATPDLCDASQFEEGAKYVPTEAMMDAATSGSVMSQFYGVEERGGLPILQPVRPSMDLDDKERLEADIIKVGQTFFGPHPTHATISGAGLTMDAAAQLNVAPFLGTELFVMWIDDHLLDGMIREILGTPRQAYPKPFIGRSAIVRPIPANPVKFTLEFYMPTLALGCIMAKFVNANPNSYLFRYWDENLGGSSDELTQKLDSFGVKNHTAQGLYTKAIQDARMKGAALSDLEEEALKVKLWDDALGRVKDIYWQWSHLPEPEVGGTKTASFASLWVTGRLCKHEQLKVYCSSKVEAWKPADARFTPACGSGLVKPAWDAEAKDSETRSALPALTKDDLQPCMVKKFDELMTASFSHIKWLLVWPRLLQGFWTIPVGKLPSDITWEL